MYVSEAMGTKPAILITVNPMRKKIRPSLRSWLLVYYHLPGLELTQCRHCYCYTQAKCRNLGIKEILYGVKFQSLNYSYQMVHVIHYMKSILLTILRMPSLLIRSIGIFYAYPKSHLESSGWGKFSVKIFVDSNDLSKCRFIHSL